MSPIVLIAEQFERCRGEPFGFVDNDTTTPRLRRGHVKKNVALRAGCSKTANTRRLSGTSNCE